MEKIGFTIQEIYNGVKSGTIKIDNCSHNELAFGSKTKCKNYFKKEFLSNLKAKIEQLTKKHDDPDRNRYRDIMLTMVVEFGHYIDNSSLNCSDCGGSNDLYPVLLNKNNISLMSSRDYWEVCKKSGSKYDYVIQKADLTICPIARLKIKDKLTAEINVESGDLIFANFFKHKELYELKTEKYHSINSVIGRIELMNDLSTRGVGYAQMGNMSVNIFLKDNGEEIIVGDIIGYDDEGEEIEFEFNGYRDLGNISLSVWRWMCADKKILEKYSEEIPKGLKANSHKEHDYKDYIWAMVKPGTWVIEHYYDVVGERADGIYSKLYLKK